jgi:hypothetical protein
MGGKYLDAGIADTDLKCHIVAELSRARLSGIFKSLQPRCPCSAPLFVNHAPQRVLDQLHVVRIEPKLADDLWGTELEFVIMVIAVSCVKLLSAHNSTQHTSRKHKV